MKLSNERGITLIELLGVLVILSVLLTLAGSILTSSLKTSNRATTEQRLQQEANYITEKVRNEYLKRVDESSAETFDLIMDNENQKLLLDDVGVISEGYTYSTCFSGENEACGHEKITFSRLENHQIFQLRLISSDGARMHEIDTKLSKLK